MCYLFTRIQNNSTPLRVAVINGSLHGVEMLLYHKANPNIRYRDGLTVLHTACAKPNNVASVSVLIEHKADPFIKNDAVG